MRRSASDPARTQLADHSGAVDNRQCCIMGRAGCMGAVMNFYDLKRRDSPDGFAYRMAGYVKDAEYIREMTLREYTRAPGVERIKEMQADHAAQIERFAKRHGGRIV